MNRPNNQRRKISRLAGIPPPELYALGSKAEDSVAPPPPSAAVQREDGPPAKRRIVAPSAGMIPLGSSGAPSSSAESTLFSVPQRQPSIAGPQQVASSLPVVDVSPTDFAEKIQEALANNDAQRVEGILCGTLRQLKENRGKSPASVMICLMTLSKSHPKLFTTPRLVQALTEVLRHDPTTARGIKTSPNPAVTVCSILLHSFEDDRNWPDSLVHAFIEDSLHERTWVDRECCRKFVENLVTAFGTVMPTQQQMSDCGLNTAASRPQLAPTLSTSDLADGNSEAGGSRPATPFGETAAAEASTIKVVSRYHSPASLNTFRSTVMQHVGEILQRRPNQPVDSVPRNALKFLASVTGLASVRVAVAPRLEQWLQAKISRYAHELLLSVCINTGGAGHEDNEVINKLVQIRLKPKPQAEKYINSMKELLSGKHPENVRWFLNCIIFNELSPQRNPNNMAMLYVIFLHDSHGAPRALAYTFQTLLLRDDYLRALRALLREVVKQVRGDIDLGIFVKGLHQQRHEIAELTDVSIKDRIVSSLVDLTCTACLLAAQPCLRDNSVTVVAKFHGTMSRIMRDAAGWLHNVVPRLTKLAQEPLKTRIRKLLFLESADVYTLENWPAEGERNGLLHFIHTAPLREEAIITLLVIGLSAEFPFQQSDALEYADRLVQRAAAAHTTALPTLNNISTEGAETLFKIVMKCALYRLPANIVLPEGCITPRLAISTMFWKGCFMLFILAVFNPKTIGIMAWKNYPILHCLMEMAMTNTFVFPPSIAGNDTREEVLARDHQQRQLEREEILAYENHLSQACNRAPVTESNSLLLNSVLGIDETGPARRPPKEFVERLQHHCKRLKLGDRLCRSRDPDFLLDIINAQGAAQSMTWLSELVASGEGSGSVDLLPTPCICEFLMAHSEAELDADAWAPVAVKEHMRHVLKVKRNELEDRVRALLCGEECSLRGTVEVLDYFFRKLSSGSARSRRLGLKCLSSVLTNTGSQRALLATTPMNVDTPVPKDEDAFDVELLLEESLAKHSPGDGIGIASLPIGECLLSSSLKENFGWLLVDLPRLKYFETGVLPCVISSLRAACLSESDPAVLRAIICFLAEHTPKEDVAAVAKDLADLVVTRPSVYDQVLGISSCAMTRIEPGDAETCSVGLMALLKVFCRALRLASKEKERLEAWEKDATQLIQFPTGEMVAIHVFVVQAIIGLLSKAPAEVNSLHQAVLDLWFPASGALPTAYLLRSHEEALLFSGPLRTKMIQSKNQRLVDAALHCSSAAQLIQDLCLFGVPLSNSSKIVLALGKALEQDSQVLSSPETDIAYVCRIVRVLQRRGMKGGERILQHKQLKQYDIKHRASVTSLGLKTVAVKEEMEEKMATSPTAAPSSHVDPPKSIDKWQTFVKKMFIEVDLSHTRPLLTAIVKVLQGSLRIVQEASLTPVKREIVHDESMDVADMVCAAFSRVLNSSESEVLATAVSQRSSLSCRILQLLSARQTLLVRQGKPSSHFVHLLDTLVGVGNHMQGGAFAHSLAMAVKQYGKPSQAWTGSSQEVTAAFSELIPQCFTRVKKETNVRPRSYTCISETLLSDFVVERALSAVRAAKEAGTAIDQAMLRTALEQFRRCNSLHLEAFVDAIFAPSLSSGRLLVVSNIEPTMPDWGQRSASANSSALVHLACSVMIGVAETSGSEAVEGKDSGVEASPSSQDLAKNARLGSLLVDRLQLLDPEMTQVPPSVQRLLLFSMPVKQSLTAPSTSDRETQMDVDDHDQQDVKSTGEATQDESTQLPSTFRQSLLVSLLAHRSSWKSLNTKVGWILSEQHAGAVDTDATMTLDFIGTCLNLPRLRQGRVRKDCAIGAESRGIGDDRLFLLLSPSQVKALVLVLLKECHDAVQSPGGDTLTLDAFQECPRLASVVQSRIVTLLAASDGAESHLATTVQLLCSSTDSAAWFLLVHLYMARPSVLQHVGLDFHPRLFASALSLKDTDCVWDCNIQGFITSMSQPSSEESSVADQNADSYLSCRFLAGIHPALLLRHLGVLSAVLRGRTHLSFQIFQGRQHHVVFTYALSLLDSARPYVFHASLRHHLLSIVTGFSEMLQQYCCTGKAFGSLADRIGQFLLVYMKEGGEEAIKFLKSKLALWKTVSKVQATSASLRELQHALSSLADHSTTNSQAAAEELSPEEALRQRVLQADNALDEEEAPAQNGPRSAVVRDFTPAAGSSEDNDFAAETLTPFLKNLEPGEFGDGLHSALVELDDAALRCPSILDHCLPHLELLLAHSLNQCTLLAIKLLLRYIRNHPQDTDRFVPAFLVCLQSPDRAVVNAVVQSLPELVIFSRKFARRLLTESFSASVRHSLDSSSALLIRGVKLCTLC